MIHMNRLWKGLSEHSEIDDGSIKILILHYKDVIDHKLVNELSVQIKQKS